MTFAGGIRPWICLAGHTDHEGVEHTQSVHQHLCEKLEHLLLWGCGMEAEIIHGEPSRGAGQWVEDLGFLP